MVSGDWRALRNQVIAVDQVLGRSVCEPTTGYWPPAIRLGDERFENACVQAIRSARLSRVGALNDTRKVWPIFEVWEPGTANDFI